MTVGILVLTWNNAADTRACLASLAAIRNPDHVLYVIDNGSDDGSGAEVEGLARAIATSRGRELRILDAAGGPETGAGRAAGDVVLLRLAANLGYAGGNNAGLRQALADGCDGAWILNNDTIVDPHALDAILEVASPGDGMVGLAVLDAGDRDRVQCLGGGTYSWWLTRARLNGAGQPAARIPAMGRAIDFVSGSCLYVPSDTLRAVGLLDERYFLYCEEIDFAERCRTLGRPLVIADGGRVWHRLGGSVGSHRSDRAKSSLAVLHATRSRILLTRKHRPGLVVVVVVVRVAYAASLLVRGRPGLARAALEGIRAGLARAAARPGAGRAHPEGVAVE